MPGMESEGALDFPSGVIAKSSQDLPYPNNDSIRSKDIALRKVTYTAQNSNWVQMNVTGPDGNMGTCFAGIHVNKGPEENTEADSWDANSLVEMADHSFKKVSELNAGEWVWNPKLNKPSQVVYSYKTMPNNSMIELKFKSGIARITGNHPFITDKGLRRASELRPGDKLPGVKTAWKIIQSVKAYKPTEQTMVYDIFLDPSHPPKDRMMNIDGLQVPGYEHQRYLAEQTRGGYHTRKFVGDARFYLNRLEP